MLSVNAGQKVCTIYRETWKTKQHMCYGQTIIKVNDRKRKMAKKDNLETNKCPGALQHGSINKFAAIYL